MEINFWAVATATVAAFVVSSLWYGAFGRRLARLSDAYAGTERMPGWVIPVEVGRSAVVATATGGLSSLIGIDGLIGALTLGLALWAAFPLTILIGSVVHERVDWRLAAIHAGDWLVKLLVIAIIVGVWR
jgi:Protein of unknown function (DUF1761)